MDLNTLIKLFEFGLKLAQFVYTIYEKKNQKAKSAAHPTKSDS